MIRLLICLAICLLGCSAQQEPEVTSEQNNLVLRTFNDNKAGFAQGESTVWFEDLATKQELNDLKTMVTQMISDSTANLISKDALTAVTLETQSAGLCAGNFASVWRDGQMIDYDAKRGLNVMTFNKDTLEFMQANSYDTHASSADANAMASFINGLEAGTVVVVASKDAHTEQMTEAAHVALESLGSELTRTILHRESFALIGRKGSEIGSAMEDHGQEDQGLIGGSCTQTHVPRPTAKIARTFFMGSTGALISAQITREAQQYGVNSRRISSFVISAQSEGACVGNTFVVAVDGEPVPDFEPTRGLNVVVIDSRGVKVDNKAFDTHGDAGANQEMSDYLDGLSDGSILAIGVKDSASANLNEIGIAALQKLGSFEISRLQYRESFAMIAVKGQPIGGTVEDHGKDDGAGESCTQFTHSARSTRVISKTVMFGTIGRAVQSELDQKKSAPVQVSVEKSSFDQLSSEITIQSAGGCAGNFVQISQDDIGIPIAQGRGMHAMVFDGNTFEVKGKQVFDTYNNQAEANRMAEWLTSFPAGTILALGVRDEATTSLTEAAFLAIEQYGSSKIRALEYRESYSLLGIKGSPIGTALEDNGRVEGGDTNECTGFRYSPRETARLRKRFYSADMRNDIANNLVANTVPQEGLQLHLDALTANSGSTEWKDLSGNERHVLIDGEGKAPAYKPEFGGYFDYSGAGKWMAATIPTEAMPHDYTVVFCAVKGAGDQYSGISRGDDWKEGNHLIGWQTPAIYQNQDRPELKDHIQPGDSFCVSHANDFDRKEVDIYINGEYFAVMPWDENFDVTPEEKWCIGARCSKGHEFEGGLVSVMIYNRVLHETEQQRIFQSYGVRLGITGNERAPSNGLVLHVDAQQYKSGAIWEDLSGRGNDVTLNALQLDNPPVWANRYGGVISFATGYTQVAVPQLNNAQDSYTMFSCMTDVAGDQYGGISRGNTWAVGNHLMGWRNGAVYGDNGSERPNVAAFTAESDNICVGHVNNVADKTVEAYVNGQLFATFSYPSWANPPGNVIGLGARPQGAAHRYTGGLGVVLLYDRALSPGEMKRLYNVHAERYYLQTI